MIGRTALHALAAAGALALTAAAPAAGAPPADPDAAVVVLRDGVAAAPATAALERAHGFRADARFGTAVRGFAAKLSPGTRKKLAADPAVDYVAPDVVFATGAAAVPVAGGEVVPAGIRRVRAATATQAAPAADVGVAVLDTGIDLASPDLNARTGTNCLKPGTPALDDQGHGTHVAGTLAARNGQGGVVGVAPGTTLHAVKVLDRKMTGSLSALICGLDWVARNAAALNIRVVNMSVGGAGRSDGACGRTSRDALHTAVCNVTAAGVTVVAAAGNTGKDLAASVPAAYPEVLAVTGMTDTDGAPGASGPATCAGETDDRLWSWSNFAVSPADTGRVVAAPGACVVSTKLGGGTTTMSGTSMAAPHAAGVVALCHGSAGVRGPCAGLLPGAVRTRVRADAQDAALAGFGFTGDLLRPVTGKVLGPLVSAAAY